MKFKKILLSCILVMGCLSASAQQPEAKTEYEFHHHWYLQIQPVGVQYTLGEIDYEHLVAYNVQLGAGYQINPVIGLRLSVNAFQSKAGSDISGAEYKWKWNYVAPMVDVTANVTNAIFGYNPKRVFNFSVFAGIGVNVAWGNDDAVEVASKVPSYCLQYLWDDSKARMAGRAGVMFDFRVCDAVSLGLEAQATTLTDHYNSKKAGNSDWYFNALFGVKVNLGKTYTKKEILPPEPQERVVEKVIEKVVEKPAPPTPPEKKEEVVVVEPLRRDVFFTINRTEVVSTENKVKIQEIADYMKKNPDAKVEITGYADKGTGSSAGNMRLSEKRAQAVANSLINDHGISHSRISISAKGDTEQPFADAVMNRVSICIAK